MTMLLLRLVISLAFVAAALWFAARIAKKRGLGGNTDLIEVLARQPMGRASSVNVIRVAGQVFLIGSTDTQVSVLGELDEEQVAKALIPDPSTEPDPTGSTSRGVGARGMTNRPRRPTSRLLAGSVFDPAGWSAVVDGLRDKTVRKP